MPSVGEPSPAPTPSVVPDVVIESGPVEQNEEAEEAYQEEIEDYFDEDEDEDGMFWQCFIMIKLKGIYSHPKCALE